MAVSPVLLVKADESTVRVRARLYDDFSDWDDPESTVNYELEQFYDLCDNIRVWVGI